MPRVRSISLALIAACVACVDLGPSVPLDFNFDGPSGGGGFGPFTVPFILIPDRLAMLKGDSIAVLTFSTQNLNLATWSSPGRAVRFLSSGGSDTAITTATDHAWIMAIAPGRDTVVAKAVGAEYRDTATFVVVDSSAITEMVLYKYAGDTLKSGTTSSYETVLISNNADAVRGKPTSWASSDTTVARLTAPLFQYPDRVTAHFEVVATRPGKVTLTFDFLSVRKTAELTVVP